VADQSRRALALAVLLLAACNKGSAGPAFRLDEPSSLALFWGLSHKHSVLHPYVAVANTGQDELVLFDPVDDTAVAAPIVIRPLSVPVPDARPALVASARFLATDGKDHADLLVAVSAGATSLQLIRTWADTCPTQDPDPGLAVDCATNAPLSVDLGAEVIALQAMPEVDGTGALVADRAWAVASLVGDRLAVVEYQLTEGATGVPEAIAAVTGTATVQPLGFEALSLAVDPSPTAAGAIPSATDGMAVNVDVRSGGYPKNPYYLYAASLDPISGATYGVAQLDLRGAPGAWVVRALDAHAPTKLVAAYTLPERRTSYRGGLVQETAPVATDAGGASQGGDFADQAVSRVYAWLDPQSCGPRKAVACGVAVLDPVAGEVLEDPWNPGASPKQHLPPIGVAAEPLALVPGAPPMNPPSTSDGTLSFGHYPYLFAVGNGSRLATGALAMPSADGNVYYADLSRWELPSNQYEVASFGAQTQVTAFTASSSDVPQLALFKPLARYPAYFSTNTASTLENSSLAAEFVRLTPGFTPNDTWSLTYQGYLPDFTADRVAQVEDAGGGILRVALQSGSGGAATRVVNVFDPVYGVRAGDIVELRTTAVAGFTGCPDVSQKDPTTGTYYTPIEGKIVSVDPPDADHPGGSLRLTTADCVPLKLGVTPTCEQGKHGPWTSKPGCWASLAGTSLPARIRAGGGGDPGSASTRTGYDLVVVGTTTGYAGRATSVADDSSYPAFSLDASGEAALVAACPIVPYSDPLVFTASDEGSRRACEAAAVARRARRRHLVSAYCAQADSTCNGNFSFKDFQYPSAGRDSNGKGLDSPYPPPTGPAIAFSVGIATSTVTAKYLLVRGTQILITTHAGYSPTARSGAGTNYGAGTRPFMAVPFDRSADANWGKQGDGLRFFAPYVNNTVLDLSPSHTNGDTHVLR
jgi:hypothetical protein